MEDELRAAPPAYRNTMSTKVRLYRRDLGKLQRDMKTSTSGFGFSRLPDEGGRGIYSSENQRSVSFFSCRHPEALSVVGFKQTKKSALQVLTEFYTLFFFF